MIPSHARPTWLGVPAIAGVAVVAALWLGSGTVRHCRYWTDAELTDRELHEYADQAFGMWRERHGSKCPANLAELNEFTFRKPLDTTDAWGHPMVMSCGDSGLTVRSAGKDGVFDSSDDRQLMSAASAATRSTE